MQGKLLKYSSLILISLIFFAGCKSWKKTTSEPDNIQKENLKQLSEQSANANFQYKWLQAKISGKIETQNKNIRFKANLRMKKDSVIWVSVKPGMGFEAIRLMVTPDSVKMMNRLKRTYIKEEYPAIKALIGIDIPFDVFQDIIIGNMPVINSYHIWQTDTTDNYHVIKEKSEYDSDKNYEKKITQEFRLNPGNYKLSNLLVEKTDSENSLVSFDYFDYKELENMKYPAMIKGKINKGSISQLNLTYKKLSISEEQEFPFSINPKYKKMKVKIMSR